MTLERAREVVTDVSYFGTMMVHLGLADGMVSGAVNTTAHTIRPALEFVKTKPGVNTVSSVFLMCLADRVLVYGDCAVIPEPTTEQLADIAISSAETARQFGIEPRVAMLSYSTGSSGSGAEVEKVRAATALVAERAPDLALEGPIQYDAAVDPDVARTKLPDSAGGRAGDGVHLPGPEHGQQHLQGGAAQRPRGRDRAGAAGAAQAGERPVPRSAGGGHREHRGDHRGPGAQAHGTAPASSTASGLEPLSAIGDDRRHADAGPGAQRRIVVAEVPAGGARDRRGAGQGHGRADRRGRRSSVADHACGDAGDGRRAGPTAGVDLDTAGLRAVGHRVVHGGPDFSDPVIIDDAAVAEIRDLIPLAPLHNPGAVAGIEAARARFAVPHVAVFDTAFFATLPAGGGDVRDPRRPGPDAPDPPLRLPRHLASVRVPGRRPSSSAVISAS